MMAYYAPFYYGQQQYQPPQQQQNNGLVWVQGEAGAKSYLVAPGNTVMLMDSEGERFYLKSADASGMPLPLRTFEYKERIEPSVSDSKGATGGFALGEDKYITREEFERRMASMASQCKCREKEELKNEPAI